MAVEPNTIEPVGDDQRWKRETMRVDRDLIAELAELRSMIEALQGRVN